MQRKIEYLTADQEDAVTIAQANAPLDDEGRFRRKAVLSRRKGEYPIAKPAEVEYMDVSPKQIVSAAASLIPFLEHDDANRALMGCNMQRQAVPLLRTEAPIVGTGMEKKIAIDSGAVVTAEDSGVVESVTADAIMIRYDHAEKIARRASSTPSGMVEYRMQQVPAQQPGHLLQPEAPGAAGAEGEEGRRPGRRAEHRAGELALGRNLLVAFMPWGGYNFEDAILVCERCVKEDLITSLHIEEFELQVRDTKRGVEEVTREIPNVGEEALREPRRRGDHLHRRPRRAGDILVGKVTPKGETELSPEEKLLRAIFGEKAGDVKDASLKAPPGMDGIVVGVRVFSRQDRTERSKKEEKQAARRPEAAARPVAREGGGAAHGAAARGAPGRDRAPHHRRQHRRGAGQGRQEARPRRLLGELDFAAVHWGLPLVKDAAKAAQVRGVYDAAAREFDRIEVEFEKEVRARPARRRAAARRGQAGQGVRGAAPQAERRRQDGRPPRQQGRRLQDHGRRGHALPGRRHPRRHRAQPARRAEPHEPRPDPRDASGLGRGGARDPGADPGVRRRHDRRDQGGARSGGLPISGKTELLDGRTGAAFDKEVTVGVMYMMKLHHLVEDKIHARSIGPYSLVTQQPLGGKAQFGGQRFGEMEVWALEAYGAANCLQEMLTVKSDDVNGRSKVYEAIVKGENPPEPGIPESFNVLMKELQSLCLDVRLEDSRLKSVRRPGPASRGAGAWRLTRCSV